MRATTASRSSSRSPRPRRLVSCSSQRGTPTSRAVDVPRRDHAVNGKALPTRANPLPANHGAARTRRGTFTIEARRRPRATAIDFNGYVRLSVRAGRGDTGRGPGAVGSQRPAEGRQRHGHRHGHRGLRPDAPLGRGPRLRPRAGRQGRRLLQRQGRQRQRPHRLPRRSRLRLRRRRHRGRRHLRRRRLACRSSTRCPTVARRAAAYAAETPYPFEGHRARHRRSGERRRHARRERRLLRDRRQRRREDERATTASSRSTSRRRRACASATAHLPRRHRQRLLRLHRALVPLVHSSRVLRLAADCDSSPAARAGARPASSTIATSRRQNDDAEALRERAWCGSRASHIAKNFGPGLAKNNAFGRGRDSNCDFNGDGRIDFTEPAHARATAPRAATPTPTAPSGRLLGAQRVQGQPQRRRAMIQVNTQHRPRASIPAANAAQVIDAFTGTLTRLLRRPHNWTIETRCTDDLVCPAARAAPPSARSPRAGLRPPPHRSPTTTKERTSRSCALRSRSPQPSCALAAFAHAALALAAPRPQDAQPSPSARRHSSATRRAPALSPAATPRAPACSSSRATRPPRRRRRPGGARPTTCSSSLADCHEPARQARPPPRPSSSRSAAAGGAKAAEAKRAPPRCARPQRRAAAASAAAPRPRRPSPRRCPRRRSRVRRRRRPASRRRALGDFMDTRLSWTFGDDDVLHADGPGVPALAQRQHRRPPAVPPLLRQPELALRRPREPDAPGALQEDAGLHRQARHRGVDGPPLRLRRAREQHQQRQPGVLRRRLVHPAVLPHGRQRPTARRASGLTLWPHRHRPLPPRLPLRHLLGRHGRVDQPVDLPPHPGQRAGRQAPVRRRRVQHLRRLQDGVRSSSSSRRSRRARARSSRSASRRPTYGVLGGGGVRPHRELHARRRRRLLPAGQVRPARRRRPAGLHLRRLGAPRRPRQGHAGRRSRSTSQLYRNDPEQAAWSSSSPRSTRPGKTTWLRRASSSTNLVQNLKDFDVAGATKLQPARAAALQAQRQERLLPREPHRHLPRPALRAAQPAELHPLRDPAREGHDHARGSSSRPRSTTTSTAARLTPGHRRRRPVPRDVPARPRPTRRARPSTARSSCAQQGNLASSRSTRARCPSSRRASASSGTSRASSRRSSGCSTCATTTAPSSSAIPSEGTVALRTFVNPDFLGLGTSVQARF